MINVTVKTLDSQNHAFDVEEDIKVKQFKEIISPTIGIPVDQQRLIFRGRVLHDDKSISEYNVSNNVVHVVQRPASQNNTANDEPPPRSSSQASGRMGDGGLFISPDDVGGGGRNAIIMGAIGLPTIDIENGILGEDDGRTPRRSGAQVRLMVGNHMLNRASTLLQQLEDDDATVAAAATSSSQAGRTENSSSDNGVEMMDEDAAMDIDAEDDQASIERIISQVVNASSAAAMVAAVRQVQPNQPGSAVGSAAGSGVPTHQSSASTPNTNNVTGGGSISSPSGRNDNASGSQNQPGTGRVVESPRLRELATSLQDLLALQERLTPFLRWVQDALRQNRLHNEQGETQSTQFAFNTVSSILHMLSHSLHAFSEIMCDFSNAPEERRLTAPSSILVEQSTVVRATIPIAAMPAGALYGAGASGGGAGAGGTNPAGASSTSQSGANANAANHPLAGLGFTMPMGQMGGSIQLPFGIPMAGMMPGGQPWRNPNLQTPNPSNATSTNSQTTTTSGNSSAPNPQQQQAATSNGTAPTVGGSNQQASTGLPPGLQNLSALLGMAGAGSTVNVNVFAGPAGGEALGQGGFLPQNAVPIGNFRVGNSSNNNPGGAVPNPFMFIPGNQGQGQQNPPSAAPPNAAAGNATNPTGGSNNNNGGAAMLQNLFRGEMNRPQFDAILPCHTYHSSNYFPRSNRPVEFRRFVDVESPAQQQLNSTHAEGESLEIIMDLITNSRLIDYLVPLIRDVVLNYLMRGRDPKNEAHVMTCAKGLAKKVLPFLEKFLSKIEGKNESVDVTATFTGILTQFIVKSMTQIIGNDGGYQLRRSLLSTLNELEKNLVQAFSLCYFTNINTSVGLRFVNYVVDQLFGGSSILFKNRIRQSLAEHVKQLEEVTPASCPLVVYKENNKDSATTGNVASSSSSSSSLIGSRCAASFGNAPSSSSSLGAGLSGSTGSSSIPVKKEPVVVASSDDVDIDEVLQLPPSMVQESPPGRERRPAQVPPPNQMESVTTSIRNLPSEWEDTIAQDVRRQRDMPPQPSFSPGYNTLFPKKH